MMLTIMRKIPLTFCIVLLMAGCDPAQRQDNAQAIKVAELKGDRAGIQKEIELQNNAISELQSRIDSGQDNIPGVRIIGPSPETVKQDKIRERLIVLRSQLAKVDEEMKILSPGDK